ncbi:MAG: aldo/keto reductase [Treponema sp.]|jgi:aryl-alcohol dehydrogenase-like predicted oxidoreductase|nr:aldo/keto reductase [Treponema sp.]
MNYVTLFPGGPEVSKLCLGGGQFGARLSREEARGQLDLFFDRGGNFVDTARVYADWIPGGHGASELTIGAWLKDRKLRDRMVISTKGAHPDLKTMHIPRMDPADIRSDLEESLRALGTDYIDLYFLHRDDPSRPAGEILQTLESFRKEGKIRSYGCSNWKLERIEEAGRAAAGLGCEGFVCNQIRWGLADLNTQAISDKTLVVMDKEIYAFHRRTKKAVMAYTSSSGGYFSKRLREQPLSPSARAVYDNEPNRILLEKLRGWEKELGRAAAVLVSAYVMNQDFPAVPIASFSSAGQLEETLPAADLVLPPELLEEIRSIKRFTC